MTPSRKVCATPPEDGDGQNLEKWFPVHAPIEASWVDGQGNVSTQEGSVLSHSGHGLELELPTRLAAGTIIWVANARGELVKAAVRVTRKLDLGDWQTDVQPIERELRATPREPVRGEATLRWVGPGGNPTTLNVRVVDLSDGGAGVIAPHSVQLGQSVRLIGERFECFCAVRHCNRLEGQGYRIGLLFARTPHNRLESLAADWLV